MLARYMPSNYTVRAVNTPDGRAVLISGQDVAGWTLDGYVLPRLASGLHFAREIGAEEAATFAPLHRPPGFCDCGSPWCADEAHRA